MALDAPRRCLLVCGLRAVGSECARGCGCDSSKSFTFTFFYALLCFGIAAGRRHRRTCVSVRECVLYTYICTCVSGSGDVDRRLCAVAVASAVKLCVSNVLCLQQSFTPIILLPLSTAMLPLHWFTQTHTGTRSKSLKQANGNGSGLHVMLVEVPAMVSLLFYHKHLRPDLTWLCAACARVPHTAAFYYTCNMGHDAMSSCLAPLLHLPPAFSHSQQRRQPL